MFEYAVWAVFYSPHTSIRERHFVGCALSLKYGLEILPCPLHK